MKENPQFIEAVSPKISLTNERFDKMIIAEAKTEQLSRIYICGPPRMNTDTAKSLLAAGFNKNHFLLV